MGRKKSTGERIADSFLELLKHQPPDKITVANITRSCDLARQIFYHHFRDKYDLIQWICIRDIKSLLKNQALPIAHNSLLQYVYLLMKKKKYFYIKILNSSDKYLLLSILAGLLEQNLKKITEAITDTAADDRLDFQIHFHSVSAIPFMVTHLEKHSPMDGETLCLWLMESMPQRLASIVKLWKPPPPGDIKKKIR